MKAKRLGVVVVHSPTPSPEQQLLSWKTVKSCLWLKCVIHVSSNFLSNASSHPIDEAGWNSHRYCDRAESMKIKIYGDIDFGR